MSFGYSLMKGRQGAAGHIREAGERRIVSVRGVSSGALCGLYTISEGEARLCDQKQADNLGNVQLTTALPGRAFVTAAGKIVLWDGGEETWMQAAAWLEKQKKKQAKAAEQTNVKTEEKPQSADRDERRISETAISGDEAEAGKQPTIQQPSDEILLEAAMLKDAVQPAGERETPPVQQPAGERETPPVQPPAKAENPPVENPPEQAYHLRPAGTGEPVDTLPPRP